MCSDKEYKKMFTFNSLIFINNVNILNKKRKVNKKLMGNNDMSLF